MAKRQFGVLADSSTRDASQVLVQAAQRGDIDAFEVLVRQHAAVVYRQVRGSSGVRAEDADDIAQEVFVRAYRFLGTVRGESSFPSWLYRLTVTVTRTYQRRRSRHWRFWADSGEGTEACVIDNHSDAVDLEQAYLRRELIEKAPRPCRRNFRSPSCYVMFTASNIKKLPTRWVCRLAQ